MRSAPTDAGSSLARTASIEATSGRRTEEKDDTELMLFSHLSLARSVWFAIRHVRTKLRWKHSRPASGAITPLTRDADLELLLQATCYLFPNDGSSRYK
jgi:hypothetical protein